MSVGGTCLQHPQQFKSWTKTGFFSEHLLYLEQPAGHGKDPPDHLDDLTQVRQERQPAEGKSHQHSRSDSHEQEKPTGKRSTDRHWSPPGAGGTGTEDLK